MLEWRTSLPSPPVTLIEGVDVVSADEIKKALKLKATFSTMLDQMQ
jgi:hypothetical protein